MATLEERLQNLERVLSIMQTEHISDIKQLGERVNELQQQITEQRRHMSEQEQSIHQRFDSLEKALSHQFATIDQKFSQLIQGFAQLNQGFSQLNQSFLRLEQQGRQQTDEIKAKFDMSDHFAAKIWGVVQEQEQDMRTTKENVQTILGRFDGQEQILKQILERLPRQEE